MFPLNLAPSDSLAKLLVRLPSPGHHADKEAMPCSDLAKILLRGKLTVCNVDKIHALQELLQRFVVCCVDAVIRLIPIVNLVRDRYRDRSMRGSRATSPVALGGPHR